jgi:hypothetical protein
MEELINKFFEMAKISAKSKTKVTIDGRIMDGGQFFAYCLDKYKWFEEYVMENSLWKLSDKEKTDWSKKLWSEYFALDRANPASTSEVFEGSNLTLSDMELVSDYYTGKEIVFNNKTRSISKMHPKSFLAALPNWKRQDLKESGMKTAVFSFNPYNDFERRMIDIEGYKVVEFNCYTPPAWRCNEQGRLDLDLERRYTASQPPVIFREFMEHLLPKESHRKFVYHWMHQALFSRNETYLVLNGKKGAGKNLLCNLLGVLAGTEYYRDANQRFFDEGFNSVLDKARLILLDEIKVDDSKKQDRLKKYINKGQNIEYKGIDANKTVETFNSYIINNNEISDMYLVWDDRRFSVPDLTPIRLLDVWSQDKVDEFVELFENDLEFQREVGFWLKQHGKSEDIGKFQWLAGDRFWKIVHHSLPEWQKVIVDAILSREKEEYTVADLKQTYKRRVDAQKFPFKIQRIADFLDSYRHQAKHKLGELEGVGENAVVIPSKQYLPLDSADDTWEAL